MDRFANPYRPGAGTPPPALIGREDLIGGFEFALRRALDSRPGKSYLTVGLRGVGKTVLLNRFVGLATATRMQVGFVEATEGGDFRGLLSIRLRKILLELDARPARDAAKRLVRRALSVLKSFTLHLPGGLAVSLDVSPLAGHADSGLLAEDLTDVMVAVGAAASECGSGVLLAVDEIQYLSKEELAALVTAIHRTTQLDLPVVLVGAGLPQLPGLVGDAKSYAERLFEFHEVGSLSASEAAEAILLPARDQEVEFEPAAIGRIVAESKGYPYFLQEWGFHVWNGSPASPVTDDDVRAVRAGVITALDDNFFRMRMDRLTPMERKYLRAMAELGSGSHRSGDIAAELGVRTESVAPRRSELISKGMIYSPAHGDTAFTVPLFDDFLRRSIPEY
ncbi:MAG: AAA family ATPase [bacterium]|nr:AAA family ATPase [bacterium]